MRPGTGPAPDAIDKAIESGTEMRATVNPARQFLETSSDNFEKLSIEIDFMSKLYDSL